MENLLAKNKKENGKKTTNYSNVDEKVTSESRESQKARGSSDIRDRCRLEVN